MPALARKRFFTRVLTCLTAAPFAFACGLGGVYLHAARWLYKHKLQPDVKLDTSVLPRMWKTLVFSMVVVIVPLCVMEGYFASIGRLRTSPELPGFKELLLHMVAFTLIEEVHTCTLLRHLVLPLTTHTLLLGLCLGYVLLCTSTAPRSHAVPGDVLLCV